MAALTAARDTRELITGAQKYLRHVEPAAGAKLYIGGIAALNAEGKAIPAGDTADLVVVGRVEDIDEDTGLVTVCSGVYLYDNGTEGEKLTVADLNKPVYALDDQTLGKAGGTNKIVAGVLRDVMPNGQLAVEIGNIVLPTSPVVSGEEGK